MCSQGHTHGRTHQSGLPFLLQPQLLQQLPTVFLTALQSSFPLLLLESSICVLFPNLGCFSPGLHSFKPCELLFVQLFLEALLTRASPGNSVTILWLPGVSVVPCCGIYHTLEKVSISGCQSLSKRDGSGLGFVLPQGSAA